MQMLEVTKLTPALVDDYLAFFDNNAHNASGAHDKCYCITFCGDKAYQSGGLHWYDTPEERRTHAKQRVLDGDIQGYLAYHNGEVIGWCNANTQVDCGAVMEYMRSFGIPVSESASGEKVKFIFCFTIAPFMQGKGVATQMLEFICQEAAKEGFTAIEAKTSRVHSSDGFYGPFGLYAKNGFAIHAEQSDKIIVRKSLRNIDEVHV